MPAPKALLLVYVANTVYLIPLFAVVAIGLLLSTVARNSAGAVVGTIGITLVLAIVGSIPGLEGLGPVPAASSSTRPGRVCCAPRPTGRRSSTRCGSAGSTRSRVSSPRYLVFLRRDVAGG